MNWKEYYKQHLMSAEDAVNHIQSGNRVVVAHACGEPSYLLDVMVANAKAYKDVEIVHMVAMGKAEYCKPEYADNFRHNAFFVGGTSRDAIAEGRGDFTPSFFFEVPRQFSSTMPVDVAMVMVTPPDENGMCSLGVSVDYTLEAVKQAKLVIAQVNPQMPWTGPYSLVSVKDLDCIVEHEAPIIELKPPKIGDIEKAIGEHCASLVPDGATLQLGIGAIPDAVLLFLKHKKDLGIHSEMFSDGVVELAEAGVITNAKKTLHPGKLIGTFAYGPLAGVLLTVVVSVIQGMTVSSGSGLMGIAMHIFATSILVLVAGNIYRVKHTKKGAVLALICGVLAMTAGMVVFNYFITPYFITPDLADTAAVAANREFVKTLLVPVIVPFNLIKAGVNSVVTFLVYKTVSRHLVHGENWKKEPGVKQAQPEQ